MVIVLTTLKTVSSAQMLFGKGLGQWVVVRDKDEGAVLEATAGKSIVDGYHTSTANALPRLDGPNGLFVGQTEAWRAVSFSTQQEFAGTHVNHTFKSSESVKVAIFARLCFVNPARITEGRGILLVAEIQGDEGVEVINLCG